jgi:hypothetical protein
VVEELTLAKEMPMAMRKFEIKWSQKVIAALGVEHVEDIVRQGIAALQAGNQDGRLAKGENLRFSAKHAPSGERVQVDFEDRVDLIAVRVFLDSECSE